MTNKREINTQSGPPRSPAYLAFIRTRPSAVSGATTGIEAAHTGPQWRAVGQKSSDFSAIPLTADERRHLELGEKKFLTRFGLDLEAIQNKLLDAALRQPKVQEELLRAFGCGGRKLRSRPRQKQRTAAIVPAHREGAIRCEA